MAMSDIPGYIMGHRFTDDPADYDSVNKRWYDKAGYNGLGAYCEVMVGDPTSKFANVASANNRRGVLMDNTWHAKMRSPIPWEGSVIVALKPRNISETGLKTHVLCQFGDAATVSVNGAIYLQITSGARRLWFWGPNGQTTRVLDRSDDNGRVAAFSCSTQARTYSSSVDGVTVNTVSAPANGTHSNALSMRSAAVGVRVGNLTGTAGDTTAQTTFDFYLFEWHWFKGNILTGAALSQVATEMAALKTFYGAS